MTSIVVKKKNEVYIKIQGDSHIHHELADYFSFEVPEAKFLKRNPKYKYWDGMIRLYSPATGELYGGLYDHLSLWASEHNYNIFQDFIKSSTHMNIAVCIRRSIV